MKYALIGCGRIATNHIKAVLNNHLEFAAACDVNPENIETLLAKHGLEKDSSIARYTDYKKMIEEVKPTLVGIATESGLHAEIALFCIDHGVNCIIEKPMAMSIEDADEIIRRSPGKEREGICLPSEPVQPGSAGDQKGSGSWALRKTVPWFDPCTVEPERRLLQPGSLERKMGI